MDHVSVLERESLGLVSVLDQDAVIGAVIRGEASREVYIDFLAATYHYVRWSGPLLARTAEGLRRRGAYPWLIALVEQKTAEEAPHHAWALADLRRLGGNVEEVRSSSPPAAVSAYVHWSLTMAEEGSPAFLGAAYTLELISMHRAKTAARNLCACRAIPGIERAVTFLDGHGDADVDHIAELSEVLRRIDDPRDQEAILFSAAVMRALYPRFFVRSPSVASGRDAGVLAA
ncbi:MAG: iron-containing redox enzyme family protein [Minicystis sp.]